MNPQHDEEVAKKTGKTIEEVIALRKSAYAKIRMELKKRGWKDSEIPETDEGLLFLIQRYME